MIGPGSKKNVYSYRCQDQGFHSFLLEYSLIVQYQKQNKQKSCNYQIKTGSSKAPIVEVWSWLSIERRVSQRGRLPLDCVLDQGDDVDEEGHGEDDQHVIHQEEINFEDHDGEVGVENLVYWMRRMDGYGMDMD